jgi:hypothetical protein
MFVFFKYITMLSEQTDFKHKNISTNEKTIPNQPTPL